MHSLFIAPCICYFIHLNKEEEKVYSKLNGAVNDEDDGEEEEEGIKFIHKLTPSTPPSRTLE